MTIQVYRIWSYPEEDNTYRINRAENWILRKDNIFTNIKEAEEYVIAKTKQIVPEMTTFNRNNNPDFEREFCFTNDRFWRYRVFLFHPSELKHVKNGLRKDGVKVIK